MLEKYFICRAIVAKSRTQLSDWSDLILYITKKSRKVIKFPKKKTDKLRSEKNSTQGQNSSPFV